MNTRIARKAQERQQAAAAYQAYRQGEWCFLLQNLQARQVTVQNSAGEEMHFSRLLLFFFPTPSGQQEVQWSSPLGQMIPAPCQKSADIHR
jgi:hypothetical protein